MKQLGISTNRLMRESESYIQTIHNQTLAPDGAVCAPLFDNPNTYRTWESTHFQLMKSIAVDLRVDSETQRLRAACFSLTHRKALFQYLRADKIVGDERVAIFASFFGTLDYSNAVITEHGRFLRSTWSLMCADFLDAQLLHDEAFVREMDGYRSIYADYFALYCGRIVAAVRGEDYTLDPLIAHMKRSAAAIRHKMMALPVAQPRRVASSRRRERARSAARRRRAHN